MNSGAASANDLVTNNNSDSSDSTNTEEKTKISFYSYNLAMPSQKEGTEQLIKEFEAENPTIEIEPVAVPSTEIATKIQADIVAGSRPDVAQIVFDSLDYAVQNYGAKALEDLVPADEFTANFEGFSPNGLQLGQILGKTYGLAFTFSTPVLFYNADLFEQAGLDPNNPPKTWEEVKQYALQITDNTDADGIHITGASLAQLYVQMVDHAQEALRTIFTLLAEHIESPCLFHCAAGKDRTGVIAAILLDLAGVPHKLIAEDYALTSSCIGPIMDDLRADRPTGIPEEMYENFLACKPEYMMSLLSHLENRYDGAEQYLKTIGVSDARIQVIKNRFIKD